MIRLTILALMLASPLAAQTEPASFTPVSFTKDIVPVLKARCASCHMTGREAGKLALTPAKAYASLVGMRAEKVDLELVKAGHPEASYLMMKLDNTHLDSGGTGARMPLGGMQLDAPTRDLIRSWIAAGAPNN